MNFPRLSQPEPYNRAHELDEELDEAFLAFLRSRGVSIIGCSANDAARTTIVKWVDPAGSRHRVDVSEFPAFELLERVITTPFRSEEIPDDDMPF